MGHTEQGHFLDRYSIIPRVLIFVFNNQDQVLLLKGAKTKKIWPGLWNGIGGHIEPGESVINAAHRELYEETNLIAEKMQFCGQVNINTGFKPGIGFFVFSVKNYVGELRESEEGIISWFDKDEICNLPLVEDLSILIPKVAGIKPTDNPFWGIYSYDSNDRLVIHFD